MSQAHEIMYSDEVQISDAVITAIHHKIEDDNLQTRISVTGTLLPDLAERLGCRDVIFAKNGTPKGGYSTVQLDTGCKAYRAVFQSDPALKQTFELMSGDSTDRYVAERVADGVIKLKFRLNYHGVPHEAIAYVLAIGSGESRLKIVPLQTEIAPAAAEDEKPRQRTVDEYLSDAPVVVASETVRNAMNRRTARRHAGV